MSLLAVGEDVLDRVVHKVYNEEIDAELVIFLLNDDIKDMNCVPKDKELEFCTLIYAQGKPSELLGKVYITAYAGRLQKFIASGEFEETVCTHYIQQTMEQKQELDYVN